MKIAFFWTWDFSANILKWILANSDIEVWLVVSQEDKYIWRKKILTKTPVKIIAAKNSIKVLQPKKLRNNTEFFDELKWFDFIVVVAYWKIVPKEVLEAPKYWCINIHGSILPQYRWASPIQEAIKHWDKETWLTIIYMSEGMDEWNILKIERINIDILDKTPDIFNKFENIWTDLLINTLNWIINWEIKWIKQNDSKATYCSKISKEDWLIDFYTETAVQIYNKYRAYYTWPWVYTNYNWKKLNIEDCFFGKLSDFEDIISKDLIIWAVIKLNKKTFWIICKNNSILIIKQVKLEWKKSMDIISFINWNKEFLNHKF